MNITNLKIDMEFASKIPPLTGEELMRLHESILTEGRCISPIVVWDGVIVDGHNRYRFLSRHPEIEYMPTNPCTNYGRRYVYCRKKWKTGQLPWRSAPRK